MGNIKKGRHRERRKREKIRPGQREKRRRGEEKRREMRKDVNLNGRAAAKDANKCKLLFFTKRKDFR